MGGTIGGRRGRVGGAKGGGRVGGAKGGGCWWRCGGAE